MSLADKRRPALGRGMAALLSNAASPPTTVPQAPGRALLQLAIEVGVRLSHPLEELSAELDRAVGASTVYLVSSQRRVLVAPRGDRRVNGQQRKAGGVFWQDVALELRPVRLLVDEALSVRGQELLLAAKPH